LPLGPAASPLLVLGAPLYAPDRLTLSALGMPLYTPKPARRALVRAGPDRIRVCRSPLTRMKAIAWGCGQGGWVGPHSSCPLYGHKKEVEI
jgi:hypothetical protein